MGQEAAPRWKAAETDGEGGAGSGLCRLVERIEGGDRAAEAELVARFSRGLVLLLRRLAQNPSLADDLHQETLALVIEKIRRGEVREPEHLAGFIRGIARNLFIAERRKAVRYRPLGEEGGRSGPLLADRDPAPLDRAMAGEEGQEVRRLLGELRFERDRELLFRFYLADDSRERICEDLDIDPDRFNQALHRARERLRELWERSEKRQRFFAGVRRIVGRPGGLLTLLLG